MLNLQFLGILIFVQYKLPVITVLQILKISKKQQCFAIIKSSNIFVCRCIKMYIAVATVFRKVQNQKVLFFFMIFTNSFFKQLHATDKHCKCDILQYAWNTGRILDKYRKHINASKSINVENNIEIFFPLSFFVFRPQITRLSLVIDGNIYYCFQSQIVKKLLH